MECEEDSAIIDDSDVALAFSHEGFFSMTTDRSRNNAYALALFIAMQHGLKRVLEIGPGADACLTKIALERGAEVWCVEGNIRTHRIASKVLLGKHGAHIYHAMASSDFTKQLVKRVCPQIIVSELVGFIASGEGLPRILADVQTQLASAGATAVFLPGHVSTRFIVASVNSVDMRHNSVLYVAKQFSLVRRLDFEKINMSSSCQGAIWEEFDCNVPLQPQLHQIHTNKFVVSRSGVVNSLALWLCVGFNGQYPNNSIAIARSRSFRGDCLCIAEDMCKQPHFTSRCSDVHAASNWRNAVIWLQHPIIVEAGHEIQVSTTVDTREIRAMYTIVIQSFENNGICNSQTIEVNNIFPSFERTQ